MKLDDSSSSIIRDKICIIWLVGWLFGFYDISTFVGYLMANPFLYK